MAKNGKNDKNDKNGKNGKNGKEWQLQTHGKTTGTATKTTNPQTPALTKMPIHIKERPLTSALLRFAVDLVETNVKSFYGADWSKKTKRQELQLQDMLYLVAEVEGRLAGFAAVLIDVEPAEGDTERLVLYVYEIQVAAEFRSQGVGSGLMEVIVGVARDNGCEWIMLTHFRANVKASGFYERHGFTEDWNSPEDKHYVILSRRVQ